jgi:hypothetical protein
MIGEVSRRRLHSASGLPMQRYLAALTIVGLLGTVLARAAMLRRQGVRAM